MAPSSLYLKSLYVHSGPRRKDRGHRPQAALGHKSGLDWYDSQTTTTRMVYQEHDYSNGRPATCDRDVRMTTQSETLVTSGEFPSYSSAAESGGSEVLLHDLSAPFLANPNSSAGTEKHPGFLSLLILFIVYTHVVAEPWLAPASA